MYLIDYACNFLAILEFRLVTWVNNRKPDWSKRQAKK